MPDQLSLKLQCSHCNTVFVLTEPNPQPATVRQEASNLFDFETQAKAEEGSLEGIEMNGLGNQPYSFGSGRMLYVETSLIHGEQIAHCGRVHGAVFIRSAIILLLGTIFLIMGWSMIQNSAGRKAELQPGFLVLSCLGLLLFCSGLMILVETFIYILTTELAVTTQRVIAKWGLISRRTMEMNLAKVENIQVDQGILGRLLGYGQITVVGTGGTHEPFRCIADPLAFRRAVQAQSHGGKL